MDEAREFWIAQLHKKGSRPLKKYLLLKRKVPVLLANFDETFDNITSRNLGANSPVWFGNPGFLL